jgi:Helix-hairpin-helix motif
MSLRSDQKALMFIGAIGVLGAGVRVVRAGGNETVPTVQPALERQSRAADSAASAQRSAKGERGGRGGRGRGTRGVRSRADAGHLDAQDSIHRRRFPAGMLDRPGYIGNRLDLDVATTAQIDSLPGVSALMARRIVADRARRGPFLNGEGLRRVSGAGKGFLQKIDTLVTFSGTFVQPSPPEPAATSRKKRRP